MEIFSLLSCGKQTAALKFSSANSESKGNDSPHGLKLKYYTQLLRLMIRN